MGVLIADDFGYNIKEESLKAHRARKGKIEIVGKVAVKTQKDLVLYYTPGVAYPCLEIKNNKDLSYEYTSRSNTIAIVTDGSRILGLGNIGPEAGMPVMEGKALLLKKFGGVDAMPLAIGSQKEEDIIAFIKMIAPSVGAINLEDLETPKVLFILDRLEKELGIPVFHDDSYGTGTIVYAALKNALKLVGKNLKSAKIVMNGVGSAGTGIVRVLLSAGAKNVIMCDTSGALYRGRKENMNQIKDRLAEQTNHEMLKGTLSDAAKGADVLIGASQKNAFSKELIESMGDDAIVFALANPDPEISYDDAKRFGAKIVATGRSGTRNQVNNMLAFPGIFRGLLDVRATKVNSEMLLAAGNAIAKTVKRSELSNDHIVPDFNDNRIAIRTTANVAEAVAEAAIRTGSAKLKTDPRLVKKNFIKMIKKYNRLEKFIERLD